MDARKIAHETRSALNAMLLGLRAARKKSAPGSPLYDTIVTAENSGKTVAEWIEILLSVGKHLAVARSSLILRECRLDDAVAKAVDQVSALAQAKGQTIEIEDFSSFQPFVADVAMVTRVLVNLLENAIKFTPEGGAIRIKARLRNNDGHPVLIVSVQDEGPGVPADAAGTPFGPGDGMGLVLCREIVETHGGRIWLETNHSPGAAFSFAIPTDLVANTEGGIPSQDAIQASPPLLESP